LSYTRSSFSCFPTGLAYEKQGLGLDEEIKQKNQSNISVT